MSDARRGSHRSASDNANSDASFACLALFPNARRSLTSSIELECTLQRNTLARPIRLPIRDLGGIQCQHVRLVVLFVVKLHNLVRDERLEGVIRVRQVREGVFTE